MTKRLISVSDLINVNFGQVSKSSIISRDGLADLVGLVRLVESMIPSRAFLLALCVFCSSAVAMFILQLLDGSLMGFLGRNFCQSDLAIHATLD